MPCGAQWHNGPQERQGLSLPHLFVFNREATMPWWLVAVVLFVCFCLVVVFVVVIVCKFGLVKVQ